MKKVSEAVTHQFVEAGFISDDPSPDAMVDIHFYERRAVDAVQAFRMTRSDVARPILKTLVELSGRYAHTVEDEVPSRFKKYQVARKALDIVRNHALSELFDESHDIRTEQTLELYLLRQRVAQLKGELEEQKAIAGTYHDVLAEHDPDSLEIAEALLEMNQLDQPEPPAISQDVPVISQRSAA